MRVQDAEQEEEKHEETEDQLAQQPNLGLVPLGGGPNVIGNIEEVAQEQGEIEGT